MNITLNRTCQDCLREICAKFANKTELINPATRYILYAIVGAVIFITFIIICGFCCIIPKRNAIIIHRSSRRRSSSRGRSGKHRRHHSTSHTKHPREHSRSLSKPTIAVQQEQSSRPGIMKFPSTATRYNLPMQTTDTANGFLLDADIQARKSDKSTNTGDVAFIAPRGETESQQAYKSDPIETNSIRPLPPPTHIKTTIEDPYIRKKSPRSPLNPAETRPRQKRRRN